MSASTKRWPLGLVTLAVLAVALLVAYLLLVRDDGGASVEPVADDSAAWCEAAAVNEYEGGASAVRNMEAPSRWAWSVCPELAETAVTDVSGVPTRLPRGES